MRNFNYSKLKYKKWDIDILNYISKISEYKGRQDIIISQKAKVLDTLVDLAIIQSTESSNEIEGIRTTDTRIKDLVMKKVKPMNRDEEEILGYQDVLRTIHNSYDYINIKPEIILQLHRDLYKYSSKSIGGQFKNVQNYITETMPGGESHVIFTPLAPYETYAAIEAICSSYNDELQKGDINQLILLISFVHDFLCIHPFNDGNGRMSRLLTTLLLYKNDYFIGRYISLEEKIEKTKLNYYEALDKSGKGWHEETEDTSYFIKYILATILAAYRDFETRLDIFGEGLTALEQVKAAIDNFYTKFTKNDIMKIVPNLSKASVENSLKTLLEEGYIERHGKGRATYYTKQ